jgi:hypothetical protein
MPYIAIKKALEPCGSRAFQNWIERKLLNFLDFDGLCIFVLATAHACVMRKLGFAAIRANGGLSCREAIVNGTTHIGTGMTNAFLRDCHF